MTQFRVSSTGLGGTATQAREEAMVSPQRPAGRHAITVVLHIFTTTPPLGIFPSLNTPLAPMNKIPSQILNKNEKKYVFSLFTDYELITLLARYLTLLLSY